MLACAAGCRRRRRRSGRARCKGAVRAVVKGTNRDQRSEIRDHRSYRGVAHCRRPERNNPGGASRGTLGSLKINDSFSKIMVFAVWASLWPPKDDLGGPRAAHRGPVWVSGSPGEGPEVILMWTGTSPGAAMEPPEHHLHSPGGAQDTNKRSQRQSAVPFSSLGPAAEASAFS